LGHDDYLKLNDMAASSLDVCLSRGGDQVVVSPYGEKLIFIGGKSEAKTKRSRVKIRVLSKSLYTLVKDADKVYIMGHKDMDLDALGSALGLFEFVKQVGKKVQIVYEERLIEYKTKKAFKQMFIWAMVCVAIPGFICAYFPGTFLALLVPIVCKLAWNGYKIVVGSTGSDSNTIYIVT
jgi:hypothetical protein